MIQKKRIFYTKITSIFSGLLLVLILFQVQNNVEQAVLKTGKGSPDALLSKYQRWKYTYEANQGAEVLSIPLRFAKAFSSEQIDAQGIARINLVNGELNVSFTGLEPKEKYTFWLVGGQKTLASTKEIHKKIGSITATGTDNDTLTAQLKRGSLQDFYISRAVLARAEQTTAQPALLAGAPGLFQRLYYSTKIWPVAGVGQMIQVKQQQTPFSFLLPTPAYAAQANGNLENVLGQQIARGRDLFINETFAGNGRTCETCHRLDNNHTIDPIFIADLPDDDPLFVSETNSDLAGLENSKLLRQFSLIKTNVDGFDRPGVFRGVPHTLALSTSMMPESDKEAEFVLDATGWSADGAPGDGSLRMFSVGAVIQHFPKTLNRIEDQDFRLPNDEELDALEAYMLSLGRSQDLALDNMNFSSPIVQRGRELFHSKEQGTGQCKGCHFNAGANSSTTFQNGNRDTGVENLPENPARLVWLPTPVDGGFGKEERNDCGWDGQQRCFGNGEFNMTTVIEAADTAPFFHNNSVNTIEEAIAFYNSNAFHASPGGKPADPNDPNSVCERCIHLESTQVVSVALFLRTINAMENIRSSNEMLEQVKLLGRRAGKEILLIAMADTEDAIEVLEGGKIIANPESLKLLKQALSFEQRAMRRTLLTSIRNKLIDRAIAAKLTANDLLLDQG